MKPNAFRSAVNRSYYTIFHAQRAVLAMDQHSNEPPAKEAQIIPKMIQCT